MRVRAWARQIRIHQWVKNLLVFVPAVAGHRISDAQTAASGLRAFVALCLCASAVYLMNDLFDRGSDRAHPLKARRPLAAGEVSAKALLVLAIAFATTAFLLMATLNGRSVGLLATYVALNVGYSFYLKRVAALDVMLLASFYTIRLLIGGAATSIPLTPWILAFSMFLFFSLAVGKRTSELQLVPDRDLSARFRRGYRRGDLTALICTGVCAGQLAVLVLALYINSSQVIMLYREPSALWMLCLLLFFWNTRFWLKNIRGEISDDPVIFAIRDPGSYAVLFLAALSVFWATRG